MNIKHLGKSILGAAMAMVFGVTSANAAASAAKCASTIEKIGNKQAATVGKNLAKCIDAINKKGLTTKTQAACEKALAKTNKSLGKAVAKCTKNATKACEAATGNFYLANGLLESTVNAPGTAHSDYACTSALLNAQETALQEQLASAPNSLAIIAAANALGGTIPNIADFVATEPRCSAHACSFPMAGENVVRVATNMGPISLLSPLGALSLGICTLPKAASAQSKFAVLGDTTRLMNGAPASMVQPIVDLGPTATVCLTQASAQGWCGCGGTGFKNYTLCQDAKSGSGSSCTETLVVAPGRATTMGNVVGSFTSAAIATGDCAGGISLALKLSTARGADTLPCTADDTYSALPALQVPFTTGNATAKVVDCNISGGTCTDSRTGAGVSCGNLDASTLAGASLVLAAPFPGFTLGPVTADVVLSIQAGCF